MAATIAGLQCATLPGGVQNNSVSATGANNGAAGVLKASPGRLFSVLVTTVGTAAMLIYDNAAGTATGTVIGVIPASAAVNGVPFVFNMPALNGIAIPAQTNAPTVTVSYA